MFSFYRRFLKEFKFSDVQLANRQRCTGYCLNVGETLKLGMQLAFHVVLQFAYFSYQD
jgi:hypothetical protein